jgi:cell pole-organizing protein PopZ
MTQPAKGQEPSMEEILASIRRIIADDEPAKGATESPQESAATSREPAAPQPLRPAAPPPHMAPRPTSPPPPRIAPAAASAPPMMEEQIDSMLAQLKGTSRQPPAATDEPGLTERMVAAEPAPTLEAQRPAIDERGLLSAATTAAVDAAFDTLARTAQMRSGRTLEELVSELLRPMLKAWLDDNLPGMVERLVRAEIERVSRGRV